MLVLLDGPPPLLLLCAAGMGLAGVGASLAGAAASTGARIAALAKGQPAAWGRSRSGSGWDGDAVAEADLRRPLRGAAA